MASADLTPIQPPDGLERGEPADERGPLIRRPAEPSSWPSWSTAVSLVSGCS